MTKLYSFINKPITLLKFEGHIAFIFSLESLPAILKKKIFKLFFVVFCKRLTILENPLSSDLIQIF